MRYFAELRYDGGAYCGWQRQPDAPTIQQTIETALSKILRTPIETTGAGRTDTGVNASYYVAHFDVPNEIDTAEACRKMNLILPRDISIDTITPVTKSAHARFDAQKREYTYFIAQKKNPFLRNAAWFYYGNLDVDRMNDAAKTLLEYSDFTSFAKLNSSNKTNICHIVHSEWKVCDDGVLCYTIRADRFLRNMVRSIVGTLVDVGRGRYSVQDFRDIVESNDLSRSSAGAPAQGLFLSDVEYPTNIFTKKTFYKLKIV